GDELKVGRAQTGCRCWLAISGGIDVPVVLGSRSTDLRASFGGIEGRALRDGDVLMLASRLGSSAFANQPSSRSRGTTAGREATADKSPPATGISSWGGPHDWVSPAKRYPVLRFVRGVDWSRFDDVTIQRFTSEAFAVSPDSDRMGVRLD